MSDILNAQLTDRLMRVLRAVEPVDLASNPQGLSEGTPRTFYVDSGISDAAATNSGLEPDVAFATIAQAVGAAVADRGDTILVYPGHTESLAAALAVNKAGVSIIGMGTGRGRPTLTITGAVDGVDITAANVKFCGFVFAGPTAAATAYINIAAADVEVCCCEFIADGDATEVITIPDAGDRAFVHDCVFRITANGPTKGVSIESASTDGVRLRNLVSHSGSLTNAWDNAFIYSTVAHTGCLIEDIRNDFGPTLAFTAAATGLLKDIWPGDVSAGASQLNPGSCYVQGGPSDGYLTRRATADIHTAGSVNLFTVTGRVEMTRIVLEVTTVIGAGADTLKLTHTPTSGSATDICAASASIANKAVGDTFGITGTYATAMVVAGVAPVQTNNVLLKAGILSSVSTNNTTGSTKVDMWWKPLDVGSAVVIA